MAAGSTVTTTQSSAWLLNTILAMVGWGILPVFGKVGSQSGLPPGLAVAIQKAAELVGVLGTIFGSSDITKATWAAATYKGIFAMLAGGVANILGTIFFNKALGQGSPSAVTGLSACYPALTLILSVGTLGETINGPKIAGIIFAVASGLAFSKA